MMLSTYPISIVPISAILQEDSAADFDPYADVFSDPEQDFIYLIELDAFLIP